MRKMYISQKPYFVTSRTQEGLPIVCSQPLNIIINGIMAKALEKYPVKLCHYTFMANHFHFLFVALDPVNASNFVGYVKAEIAHAINQMLGIKKRTIWDAGFDSPILLDSKTCINKIAYIYANPARANLVSSVDKYPGVSSWHMYKKESHSKPCFKIPRDKIYTLGCPALGIREQIELSKELLKVGKKLELKLEPDAWMKCFEGELDEEYANKEIIELVYQLEDEYEKLRVSEGKSVIGELGLKRQSMGRKYRPKNHSKKMICLGESKAIRAAFIKLFKGLVERANNIYQNWKRGDFSENMPPGMFAPRKPNFICCLEV